MHRYTIEPSTIRAHQGEILLLVVSSDDVQHGFRVEQLGINEPVPPGRPAEIQINTSKKGNFLVTCSILCGPGHDEMRATIVVE